MDSKRSKPSPPSVKEEEFSSIIGFIFTIVGFAIGVGSLWRFPYICGVNGGAVFIIVYILFIIAIGIPILTAEISIGYYTKKTAVQAYKALEPAKSKWHLAGYVHALVGLLIISYCQPIYASVLHYMVKTPTGFFETMTPAEISAYYNTFSTDTKTMLIFVLLNVALCSLGVIGGVKKGVEAIAKFLLPLLGVIMVVIIIAGLQLEGAGAGVSFLLKPDISKFGMDSLLACLGQAFFAIGIGMLASMVFGAYLPRRDDKIHKSSAIICISIVLAGIAAGFMIFPMVFAFGFEPSGGSGLTFITLPNVFNQIPYGTLIGTLFYAGFYIAAYTSVVGILEPLIGFAKEELKWSRKKSLALIVVLNLAITVPTMVSQKLFGIVDMITNNYLLVGGALVICIFAGWVWGTDNFLDAANVKNPFLRKYFGIVVKYVSPFVILTIFIVQFI